ncbi:hypothetical protein GGU10DRAFT_337892 [Lentinula aff. detonsa]|uniref:Uncharacterized protein n=1 Tax=Lentinula aff. detonsa TaxID=2804958 RepID=A0AA38KSN8_9AGAR|nr:hypothetical protein GGU10DRAFT_337892 [Lentinula aff. detonsa]
MSSNGNLNVIIDSAKDLFYQIAQLEPPGPNASPRSKKRFHKMLRTVSQASGQTYDVAVGIGQSIEAEYGGPIDPKAEYMDIFETNLSDGDDDEQPTGLVQNGVNNAHGTARPPSSPIPTHLDIAAAVFSDVSQDEAHQYDITDFSRMVVEGGHRGKAQNQEYEAFRRALIGYKLIPCQEIMNQFVHISAHASTFAKTALRALNYDNIEDIGDRLSKRERIIFNGSKRDKVWVYLFNIIRNIEGIKAYEEWSDQSLQFKQEFRTRLARELYPDEFESLDQNEVMVPRDKKKLYNKLINPVRKKHDKLIMRRRQISRLFKAFGPVILLEPTFLKSSGRLGYPQQSPEFVRLLEEVLGRAYTREFNLDRYTKDRKFVLRVMQTLGGWELEQYGRDFLDNRGPDGIEFELDRDYFDID